MGTKDEGEQRSAGGEEEHVASSSRAAEKTSEARKSGERGKVQARGTRVPPSQRETEENHSPGRRRKTSVTVKICGFVFSVGRQHNRVLGISNLLKGC